MHSRTPRRAHQSVATYMYGLRWETSIDARCPPRYRHAVSEGLKVHARCDAAGAAFRSDRLAGRVLSREHTADETVQIRERLIGLARRKPMRRALRRSCPCPRQWLAVWPGRPPRALSQTKTGSRTPRNSETAPFLAAIPRALPIMCAPKSACDPCIRGLHGPSSQPIATDQEPGDQHVTAYPFRSLKRSPANSQ
jgi:hypothetical protein